MVSVGRGRGTAAMGPSQCRAEPGTEVSSASESKGSGGREEGKNSRKQQREHQDHAAGAPSHEGEKLPFGQWGGKLFNWQ